MVQLKKSLYITLNNTINLEAWLQYAAKQRNPDDISLIHQAYSLSRLVGDHRPTLTGPSCVQQGLTMAEILLDLHLDKDTIAAALVYSSIHYAGLTLGVVQDQLGHQVTKLLQGALRMNAICNLSVSTETNHNQLESIRKMLLAMVEDMRVVLIKLAERTVVMRTLYYLEATQIKQYAQETLSIYAPLANRLGIDPLKWELEDLSLHYLEPVAYSEIACLLNERLLDREAYIQQQVVKLKALLKEANIKNCQVYGRVKHLYSIYRKMQRKNLPFSEIYDLNALRILVNTVEECYTVLGIVQGLWPTLSDQFDDYISTPKSNGYRSIHTVVNGPNQKLIEIQIRTYQMHQESEHGVAAHWQYKEEAQQGAGYQTKIAWLRHILEWQKTLVKSRLDIVSDLKTVLDDRIYLFTPAGDIVDLPKGATPLDFAYHIHSDVGHRCRGAKVNGAIASLTYNLNTGDQVEILTAKQPNPSRDWLNTNLGYLHTTRARTKVHHWFKAKDHDRHLAEGQALFEKECQRLGLTNIDQENLSATLHFKSKKDMLVALGNGDLRIAQLLPALTVRPSGSEQKPKEVSKTVSLGMPHHTASKGIRIGGLSHLLSQTAGCCKPVPGDPILGFTTQTRGVILHRYNCTNMAKLRLARPERLVEANWGPIIHPGIYPSDISLEAYNRSDLVRDISMLVTNERLNLIALSMIKCKASSIVHVKLTVEILDLKSLSRLLAHLKNIPNVIAVHR